MAHMNILSIEQISKTVQDEPLFSEISLGFEDTDRVGLIGSNGTGKSTFLRLISGQLEPDEGKISKNHGLRISVLEQIPTSPEGVSVSDFLYEDDSYRVSLLRRYHEHLESFSDELTDHKVLDELNELMEREGCWSIEHEYQSKLTELGITDLSADVSTLSGGMLKKAALARALASRPNFLILDEPTNHLDIETIEWLEQYLLNTQTAFLMVTHDRYILDAVCTRIIELDDQRIFSYDGSYSVFLEMRAQRITDQQRYQEKIANILRKEREWLSRGPKARTSKNRGRIDRAYELMDQQVSMSEDTLEFSSQDRRMGKKVLELQKIEKQYGDTTVVKEFSYSFSGGERIGIVGPNGSGKSTFLNMITGRIELSSGSIDRGINTVFGYYDQLSEHLDTTKTVLEYLEEIAERVTLPSGNVVSAARFLEQFNFPVRMHRVEISRLSGGERRRLYLISTLMRHPNFLILDEPTNDLDIDTMRKLEEYIQQFSGSLITVSHDRAFLDRTTDYLFVFDQTGKITGISGSYSDYRAFLKEQEKDTVTVPEVKNRKSKPVLRQKKGLSYREQKEFEQLEVDIDLLEEERRQLDELFCSGDVEVEVMISAQKRYQDIESLLEDHMERWEHLAAIADQES